MKKKVFIALTAIVLTTSAVFAFSSLASQSDDTNVVEMKVHSDAASQGKHCTGTVGCDCSGFSPITNGEEWQKDYCKRCGHKKSYHR